MKKGWEKRRLHALTTKIGSGATPLGGEAAYMTVGIPLIRSLNVYDDGFRTKDLAYIDDNQAAKLENVIVETGDVLLNITGASVARCCIAPKDFLPARVNQHVSIIRPVKESLLPEFLHYLLISRDYKNRLLAVGEDGGSTRQAITKAQLLEFEIEFPPLPEQQRIVRLLDEAFARLATAQAHAAQNLQNARDLFESHLNAVFTHRGEGWVEKTLSDICEISSSLVDPREKQFLDLPHVGGANIESKTGALIDIKTAREEGLISGKFAFDDTTVLYSKIRPYLMKVARPGFHGLCSADIYPMSPKAGQVDRDYLFHLMLSKHFTDYANIGSARAGMPKVNREHLFQYRTFLPSVAKQKELVTQLDALSAETQRLTRIYEQKLAALAALKKSLLHQAFNGHF
jgi:type I restriction enzyme S subunit